MKKRPKCYHSVIIVFLYKPISRDQYSLQFHSTKLKVRNKQKIDK